MDGLISKRSAHERLIIAKTLLETVLQDMPTAEPRKGKWEITDAYPHNVYCSECHKRYAQTHWAVWEDGSLPRNFCPNCGARMEEENNESDNA